MNEIDLVRRFRAGMPTHDEDEMQHARHILMKAIEQDRNRTFGVSNLLRHAPRRSVAVVLAVLALPGSYAIARSAGVFDGGTVDLTLETATPASAPGSESEPADPAPAPSEFPDDLAPGADEPKSRHRARPGTVDPKPKTAPPTAERESDGGKD